VWWGHGGEACGGPRRLLLPQACYSKILGVNSLREAGGRARASHYK